MDQPTPLPSLNELARKYDTDKADSVTWAVAGRKPLAPGERRRAHNYCGRYAERFEKIRRRPIRLLELGVLRGASLRMWRDYFPRGLIYGIDLHKSRMIHDEERIVTFVADVSKPGTLAGIAEEIGPLDIIVDDASHRPAHQLGALRALLRHVRPNGYYVIEDLGNQRGQRRDAVWHRLKDDLRKVLYGYPGGQFGRFEVSLSPNLLIIHKR